MTSFKIERKAKDRAGTRFVARFYQELMTHVLGQRKRHGLTQRAVAEAMEVDKAFVSRILSGASNPTLRTVGELAWALKLRPEIKFYPIEDNIGDAKPVQAVAQVGRPAIKTEAVHSVVAPLMLEGAKVQTRPVPKGNKTEVSHQLELQDG